MEMNILFIGLAIFTLVFGTIIHFKKTPIHDIMTEVKEPLLMLFLYAEKQEWSGPDKMEWCLKQLTKKIHLNIDEATLEKIAKSLYSKYHDFIKDALD